MSKKKTGPTKQFPLEELEHLFEQHKDEIILDDDRILRPGEPFWEKLKPLNKIGSSAKSIHTDAKRWQQKIRDSEKKDRNYRKQSNDFDDLLEEESSDNEVESSDESIISATKNDIQFFIKLSHNIWKLIEPIPCSCHRLADKTHSSSVRKYLVLRPGMWSSVFMEKIAEHRKNIICDWSFKNSRVSNNGKYYVTINANCINCESKLFAFLKTKPNESEEVVFTCTIKGFDETRHNERSKKVKVYGSQAQSLATSKQPAIVLHRQLSAK